MKHLIPGVLRQSIFRAVMRQLQDKHKAQDEAVPKYELAAKHVAHLRHLLTRSDLLDELPKGGIVAELGVDKGDFSAEILTRCAPKRLHLIDTWGSARYHDGLRQAVAQRFGTALDSGQIRIEHGLSTAVAAQFPDAYFDWIYIDTDHTYQTTLQELRLYAPKMKPGGIIAGHDFIIGNWNGLVRYGVIEAVYQFCVEQNWALLFLTLENAGSPSFAIRAL